MPGLISNLFFLKIISQSCSSFERYDIAKMTHKAEQEDLDFNIETTSLSAESDLDSLQLNEGSLPTMKLDRLQEFMKEPIILHSGPVEPISPGGIGYSREGPSTARSAISPSHQPGAGLETANNSFLALPPLSPTEIDEASDIESIRSFSSDSSTPSSQSSSTARLDEPVADFISFLTTDKVLQPLFKDAVGVISASRFQRNFGRLLRMYARQLKCRASDETEEAIAMFVRRFALSTAIAVTRHFFPQQERETRLHELLTLNGKNAVLVETCLSKIDAQPSSKADDVVSDLEDDGASFVSGYLDENLPKDSERITKFMVTSEAFTRLRRNLKAFLASETVRDNDMFEHHQEACSDEVEDPKLTRSLIRRATQVLVDEEEFFRDLNSITESRTSTGLSEDQVEWSILYFFLLFWEIIKMYYILILQYLLSLVPPADLARLSNKEFQPAENWKVIYLYDVEGEAKQATVRLDTGSDLNVISMQKVEELGKKTQIECKAERGVFAFVQSANGVVFKPRGSLVLRWSLKKNSKIYKEEFFVIEDCPEEVLFGNRYIQKLQLLESRWPSLLLTVWDKKPKRTEADVAAEKRRQEEKKALEEKKRNETAQPSLLQLAGKSVVVTKEQTK